MLGGRRHVVLVGVVCTRNVIWAISYIDWAIRYIGRRIGYTPGRIDYSGWLD